MQEGGQANGEVIEAVVDNLVAKLGTDYRNHPVPVDPKTKSSPDPYTPKYVCIGPRHWSTSSDLQRLGRKVYALRQLLDMAKQVDPLRQQMLQLKAAKGRALTETEEDSCCLAHLARNVLELLENNWNEKSYGIQGYVDNSSNKIALVEMMLLDGIYLIARFGELGMQPLQQQERSDDGGQPQPQQQSRQEKAIATVDGSSTSPADSPPSDSEQASPLASSGITTTEEQQGSPARGEQPPRHPVTAQNNVSAAGSAMPSLQKVEDGTQPPSSCDDDEDWDNILRDTWYLVENQMPFQVVERIYVETTGHPSMICRKAFIKYAVNTLLEGYCCSGSNTTTGTDGDPSPSSSWQCWIWLQECYRSIIGTYSAGNWFSLAQGQEQELDQLGQGQELELEQEHHNLLHLLYILLPEPKSSSSQSSGHKPQGSAGRDSSGVCLWRPATDYVNNSNVWFQKRDLGRGSGRARSVLDVSMDKGDEVRIPQLTIDGATFTILRNLMALERQLKPAATYVTDYCLFMSQLACTAEDVRFLQSAGVIRHTLGDPSKVAEEFGNLCSDVTYSTEANYLKPIWHTLEARYRSPWHQMGSWLRLNYCNGPAFVLFIFAALAFVSEVLGTAFQIASYVLQKATTP